MWIVGVALKRPYTFFVLAIALMILGPLAILRTPTDIFPNIDIPVISVVWSYTGLPADEMADRIVGNFERAITTAVNDVEHTESQSLSGVSVIKVYFQPKTNISIALSQMTSIAQTALRFYPQGTQPPLVLNYNAASVPVIQLALSSKTLGEQEIFDIGSNFIRSQLATVQGASLPFPYGGKEPQVQVDLNQAAMQAFGVSPADVNAALDNQNLILPAGTEKIGSYEYNIKLNASPTAIDSLNDFPVKYVNGTTIRMGDVAHVRNGYPPQTNIVRVDGHRAVLMTVQKTGDASTLSIVSAIKDRIPQIRAAAPPGLSIHGIGDQSIFVTAAVGSVLREAIIAAALTGLMILLFLGSWRSTLIITVSIPLSILASIIVLSAIGETINIMTLGGLALAVGILVDDATVAIENINVHIEEGLEVEDAIMKGAHEIAVPALVSTLCICIVFVPMFMLTGVARYLFVPLAEAVVFAMLASYVLSRTLVPTLAKYLLRGHRQYAKRALSRSALVRFQYAFQMGFDALRDRYRGLLEEVLTHRKTFAAIFFGCVLLSFGLAPWLGENFFPSVDAGQLKLHFRAHTGTRIEETARLADLIEARLRQIIPPPELQSLVDNLGLPYSGINLSYSNAAPIGPGDGDIQITFNPDHHSLNGYMEAIRAQLPHDFPGVTFSFLPADIVSQILNFGLPSPIDVQIVGKDIDASLHYADALLGRMRHIAGIADLRIQQRNDYPEFRVAVDRIRAAELGLTQHDVADSMLVALSGSSQTTPTFWLNRTNHVSYPLVAQTPQYQLNSLDALRNLPITSAANAASGPQLLGALAATTRGVGPAVVTHYNVQPTVDIYASYQDRDLGAVGADVQRAIAATAQSLPPATGVVARGQMQTMRESFTGLYTGLLFAIVLVYLLIVVNFQSWVDPFIITSALPAALAGVVWMLFVTQTTLSVPALTGAIMCIGVATANSILIVSFARERLDAGADPVAAALEAGAARFRPVLMTALAMIIGMVPMALALGEGAEQNAPLGRAVIGGLLFATAASLFFVPVVFALVHGRATARPPHPATV